MGELSLQEFRSVVEKAASKPSSEKLSNSGKEEGAVVMANIYKKADHTVRMYCGGLRGDLSNDRDYTDQVGKFLRRSGKVNVLLEESPPPESDSVRHSDVFRLLRNYHFHFPEQVKIKIAESKFYRFDGGEAKPVHFTLGDTTMYRIETDTKNYRATFCFDDEDFVKEVSANFDREFKVSKELS